MTDNAPDLITLDYRVVASVLQVITIIVVGGAGWMIKYIITNLQREINSVRNDLKTKKEDRDLEIRTLKEARDIEIRELRSKLEASEATTNDINIKLPSQYVTKLEFSRMVDALFGRFDKVMEKMDTNKKDTDDKFANVIDKINNGHNGNGSGGSK